MNLEVEVSKYIVKHFEDRRDRRFLPVELWIVSEGLNRNKSVFTPESLVISKDRFKNISLSAKYEQTKDDFKGHEVVFKGVDKEGWAEYEYIEAPIGVIPESSNPRIETDEEGKQWIVTDALVWSERNRKVEKLLTKNGINNISMEIKVLDYEMDGDIQIIKDFMPMSVVFISNKHRTGIAKARAIIKEDEIKVFSESLVLAFSDNIGMGNPIKFDFKFKSISNDSWASIDKDSLRNDCFNAENYEEVIKNGYLLMEDGWQNEPETKLDYPIFQLKNGKMVYNRNAIVTARRRLEGNKGEDYYPFLNAKLIKIEKKLGLWKEYDYAKFEGGGTLDNEKLKVSFLSTFGADLISFENGIVTYLKHEDNNVSFVCKKYAIEPCTDEDGEESETLLVSDEEFACEPKFVMEEKTEVDGQEVVTEKFACGGEKVKEFILSAEQLTSEKQKMFEEQTQKNIEFEAKIEELNKQYEKLVSEKNDVELKNKQYEEEKVFEKMKTVVRKYENDLKPEEVIEWEAKAKSYSVEESLEKDLVFSIYNGKSHDEHFKSPAKAVKPIEKRQGFWDVLTQNVSK